MRQDQLQQARLARWRQDGNALATLDDAERWLAETPLCLYLPRPQHLPVPAPSFVEAIAGRADPTPAPDRLAAAEEMLARLVAAGAVVALNLFGAPAGIAGERPDFLATPEALPYLYALQPERNPKRSPVTTGASRVSPLASESYHILEREGALTVAELRQRLGREVTEAATLRALGELWHTLRVVPVAGESGSPAHWELLSARHRRELNVGSTQSQTTALSILASFYLQSVIAASAAEVEAFLSPLAARSRIRDVVHGLSTTRQLASFPLNGEGQLYVEGTLPELPAEEETLPHSLEAGSIPLDAGLEQNEPSILEATVRSTSLPRRPASPDRPPRKDFGQRFERRSAPQRPAARRDDRSGRPDSPDRKRPDRNSERGGDRRPPRPSFADRARTRGRGAPSFDRPRREAGFSRPPSADRPRPAWRDRKPDDQAREQRGESSGSFRKPGGFGKRGPGKNGPGQNRFERPQGTRPNSTFDRPRRDAASGKRWERPGASAPARPRFPRDDARPDRTTGRSSDRREARSGDRPPRPFRPRDNDSPRSFRDKAPRRDGEVRPPFRGGQSRPQGGRPFKRPYAPAGDRPPRRAPAGGYGKFAAGDRPPRKFPPRPRPQGDPSADGGAAPRAFRPAGQRPSRPGGFRKPGAPGKSFAKQRPAAPGGRPAGSGKGRTSTTTSSGKPRRPGGFDKGRPGRSAGRPPAKGGFQSGGFKPGSKRPGGFAPPRRKPRGESRPGEDS